ncbi:hypothetical protein SAMN04489729_1851 [Amycolatopsis lurida]|uniref:Uncharacterized protein n=1 Tax=Amycolatopsis lurida NRRL 2430 TaxID=1460371 RepID=A0A2P2FH35_AMYLU|nr:hypothetical protein [Amycolatopsis lurida]KFU76025.1 hypothetical protein BB31_38595 [Amycolatopsis lurida NRRL 2430]SEC55297.1 hypothetical protein SAMN04489729_1851 [Amycolatopsis lurida]
MAAEWKPSPVIKIYEALGAVADGRVEIDGDTARVASSDKAKTYDVRHDPAAGSITANDNGSYWQGYLGYPGIAYLMERGVLAYDSGLTAGLAGVPWKELATEYRNDWAKVEKHVREDLAAKGVDLDRFDAGIAEISDGLEKLALTKLSPRQRPPK